MSRVRIPVALIAAPGAAARSARVAQWLEARPAGERWAVLVEGGLGALAAVGSASGGEAAPGAAAAPDGGTSRNGAAAPGSGPKAPHVPGVVAVALGGCACCTGATVLRVTLTRLLRAGGLDRILIVVGAAARPEAVSAMLCAPPFEALLEPCAALLGEDEAERRPDGASDAEGGAEGTTGAQRPAAT